MNNKTAKKIKTAVAMIPEKYSVRVAVRRRYIYQEKVNHYEVCKKIYQKQGMAGVDQYVAYHLTGLKALDTFYENCIVCAIAITELLGLKFAAKALSIKLIKSRII